MPSGPLVATRLIVNTVLATSPSRILDLGMGTGKYGFLLREQSDFANGRIEPGDWEIQIDGVEGYAAYIGAHQRAIYDSIVVADVVEFLSHCEPNSYDVALALDIIEHFSPQTGVLLVRDALRVAKYVLVSTPKGYYAQEHEANELEMHRSWWPARALSELARLCDARVSVAQVRMTNLAILCRNQEPPRFEQERFFEMMSLVKDSLLPELWYYRKIRKTGPTIFDV